MLLKNGKASLLRCSSIFVITLLHGCNGAGYEGPVLQELAPRTTEFFDGDQVTFTAIVRPASGTTFQWGMTNSIGTVKVPGETNQTYNKRFSLEDDRSQILVTVTAPGQSIGTAGTAPLTVKPKPITFTQALPTTIVVAKGNSLIQGVQLNYATPPIAYQWNKNNQPIIGQTSALLTLLNVGSADNGAQLTVTATNVAGAVTSNAMTLNVQ